MAIRAKAFDFDIAASAGESEAFLYYDGGDIVKSASGKCVIIGDEKGGVSDSSIRGHYVLIVQAISDTPGQTSYERVGVGYFLGRFILFNRPSILVTIE